MFRDRLANHLSQLRRDGLIEELYDQKIQLGKELSLEQERMLSSAQIILLLISADFLAADTQYQIEMQRALERHKRGEVCVIPIIVRPCDWQHSPFADLPCLPRNSMPITSWGNQEEAFAEVARNIRGVIENQIRSNASISRSAPTFPQPEDSRLSPHFRRSMILLTLLLLFGMITSIAIFTHLQPSSRPNGATGTTTTRLSAVPTNSSPITISTPLKTLQTLCSTDYQTQWNLFSSKFRADTWFNESKYASDLRNRDKEYNGVASCKISKVIQNGSSASGIITMIFNSGLIDPKIFQLTKEQDNVWRVDGITN